MKNFLAGLAAFVAGFFVWITASVFYGITTWDIDTRPPMFWWIATPAFLIMIGGPFWFWFIVPLWSWLSRPTAQETPFFFELGWGLLKGLIFLGGIGLIIVLITLLGS